MNWTLAVLFEEEQALFKLNDAVLSVINLLFPAQYRVQELCESRGGRPGLPSLISLRFLWT